MKKFIGIKMIEAEPMTVGEAIAKGYLMAKHEGVGPSNEEEGYHVHYPDSGAAQRLPYLSRVDDLVPSKKRFSEKMTSKLTIWCNLKRFFGTKRKI